MKYIFIFITAFLLISHKVVAQNNPFTQEQLNKFARQAKDYVIDFTKAVKSLSNPNSVCDKVCRQNKIEGIVKHFKSGAFVQTVTLKNKTPKPHPVEKYLNSIVASYSIRFKLVIITFENIVLNVKSFKELKNSSGKLEYSMTGSFKQKFCVKNEKDAKESNEEDIESFTICEETVKEFEVRITKIPSASGPERWVVLLGDIKAKSIKSLKEEND